MEFWVNCGNCDGDGFRGTLEDADAWLHSHVCPPYKPTIYLDAKPVLDWVRSNDGYGRNAHKEFDPTELIPCLHRWLAYFETGVWNG